MDTKLVKISRFISLMLRPSPARSANGVWLTEQVPVEYLDINTNSEVRA